MKRKAKKTGPAAVADEPLRRLIIETVRDTPHKLTQIALESAVRAVLPVTRQRVRTAVHALVSERELAYTSHFGCSFLEPSFQRPVLISNRVVVKPPDCRYAAANSEIVVSLAGGSAFGSGEHPTTRLAVHAVEHLLLQEGARGMRRTAGKSVLDVGTGSGVLVIVAVLLGIKHGLGVDIDACARSEARQNVRLNRLEDRIAISDHSVDRLQGPFSLITANLRYPSLARLADCLTGLTEPGGGLVFSGVRPNEMPALQHLYTQNGFSCRWQNTEGGWGGLAFCKKV